MAAAAAVEEGDGAEVDTLGLACSAAADALSGSLSGEAGDLEAERSGRPLGVEAALLLAEEEGDAGGDEGDVDPDAGCGVARPAPDRRRGLGSVLGMGAGLLLRLSFVLRFIFIVGFCDLLGYVTVFTCLEAKLSGRMNGPSQVR